MELPDFLQGRCIHSELYPGHMLGSPLLSRMLTLPRLFALEIYCTSITDLITSWDLFYFRRWLMEKEIHPNSDFSLLTAKREKKKVFYFPFSLFTVEICIEFALDSQGALLHRWQHSMTPSV